MDIALLRTRAAKDPIFLPKLIARDPKFVRDAVDMLYREHRSGRDVANRLVIDFRTLKRWLLKFEEMGMGIPETSKGDYGTRDANRLAKPLKNRAKKKRSKRT